MISSLPVAWTLTALFTATGLFALLRWASAVSARLPAAHRTAELAHLVMSAAMVVMTWTRYGPAGLWTQIVLFGVFGVFFLATAVRGTHGGPAGRMAGGAHALMAVAMVWMLAAMPLIMPGHPTATGGDAHAGHAGRGGSGAGVAMHHGAQAGWAVAITVLLCGLLAATAGFWASRALGAGAPAGDPLAPHDAAPLAPGDSTATSSVVEAPTPVSRAGRLGAREDAVCHTLMCAGMAVMLVAMVAGW